MTKYLVGVLGALALLSSACESKQTKAANEQQDYRTTVARDEQKKAEVQNDANKQVAELNQDEAKQKQEADQATAEAQSGTSAYEADQAQKTHTGAAVNITGTVKGTPFDNLTLIDKNGGEIKLDTDKATQITSSGAAIKLHDIKNGAEVRAAYHMDGDTKKADRIEVLHNPANNEKVRDDGSALPK